MEFERSDGLRHQRAAAAEIAALADFEDDVRRCARQLAGKQTLALDAADLGHRALRAPVFLADPEDGGVEEGEGVIEHQPFDLTVGFPAPRTAGNESPAD